MYYITKKDSETGKKFQQVLAIKDKAQDSQHEIALKYGFEQWRPSTWAVFGGISSCIFKEKPSGKGWKKLKDTTNEYMPDNRTTIGKAIKAEIDEMPMVSHEELNMVINFDYFTGHIGFGWTHDEYFGFSTNEKWKVEIPSDCEEVTLTRYRELFPTIE